MSDYTRITNFTAKDILATGNPSKKVLGSEIDAEYNAARTAINSKQDDLIATRGDILRGSSSNIAERLALGAAGLAAISNGTDLVWGAPFGIVGLTYSADGALNSGTTTMPWGTGIPQDTDGDEYLSVTHTPAHASNTLLIFAKGFFGTTAAGNTPMVMSLFSNQSGGNDALASTSIHNGNNGAAVSITLIHALTAGTTSATTFSIRAGNPNAGTTYFNGQGGTVRFGGVSDSILAVLEIRSAG